MKIAEQFDPYHKWLGIAPADQPPTHYRLLGLQKFESDPDVVEAAADRQSAYLRTVQGGKHQDQAAQMLNAVAQARVCLLNPKMKANYDAVLRSAAPAESAAPPPVGLARAQKLEERDGGAPANFGAFEVLETIRRNKLGNVFKARHRESGRLVTLKILPPTGPKEQEILRRFEREQRLTTSLAHPNLIAGYAVGVEQGQQYLVTEYVVGADLETLVQQQGPLPVEQAVDYLLQAARGLTQLHMNGVYHRNIKPQVLFVDMQGRLKVTSLFLARLDEYADVGGGGNDELTRMGQLMGTPDYMAPEQASDASSVDARADVYSLGCTLFYLLTGRPPYEGKSLMAKLAAHRTQPIPSLAALRPDVPPHVERVFQQMMAKEPDGRYAFMGDVVEALESDWTESEGGLWQKILRWFKPNKARK